MAVIACPGERWEHCEALESTRNGEFRTPEGPIGILDAISEKLGLKGEDWSQYSAFLGEQLDRILSANLAGASTDALLLELDPRTQRFVDKRGEEELVRALESWVYRTKDVMYLLKTLDFQDAEAFKARLARLEKGRSPLQGLRTLEHALYCMGILEERLYPERVEQDPRTALPAIVDVLWPMTRAEDALQGELASLIEAESWRPRWELLSLRLFALDYVVNRDMKGDDPARTTLYDRMNKGVTDRAHGTLGPSNLEEFLRFREKEYRRGVRADSPIVGISPTAFVGGTFAWLLKQTTNLRVRLIGAREWAIAVRRLESMVAGYRT